MSVKFHSFRAVVVVGVLLFALLVIATEAISKENKETMVEITLIQNNSTSTNLQIEIDELQVETVKSFGASFQQITLNNEYSFYREGWLDLPVISRLILAPPWSDVCLKPVYQGQWDSIVKLQKTDTHYGHQMIL